MASALQDDGLGLRQRTAKSSSKATTSELTPRKGNVAPKGPPPAFTVYLKLAVFSVAMFALPLATYFTLVARGVSSTWAGGAAAVAANIVLVGYIIAAFLEDGEMGSAAATPDKRE